MSEQSIEPTTSLFAKPSKRGSILQYEATPLDLAGREGRKYRAQNCTLLGENNHLRKIGDMFIKTIDWRDRAEENSQLGWQTLRNYEYLKKNHFPVVPTLRFDSETNSLLMTDVTKDGSQIIDRHHPLNITPVEITNLEECKQQLRTMVKDAYAEGQGIYLGYDSYAIVVKDGIGKVMFLDISCDASLLKGLQKGDIRSFLVDEFCSKILDPNAPVENEPIDSSVEAYAKLEPVEA